MRERAPDVGDGAHRVQETALGAAGPTVGGRRVAGLKMDEK
jgi:hypothetical protein